MPSGSFLAWWYEKLQWVCLHPTGTERLGKRGNVVTTHPGSEECFDAVWGGWCQGLEAWGHISQLIGRGSSLQALVCQTPKASTDQAASCERLRLLLIGSGLSRKKRGSKQAYASPRAGNKYCPRLCLQECSQDWEGCLSPSPTKCSNPPHLL